MAYINTIGTRIKELRMNTGITQAELARRLQLTRSSINSWEQELSYPSIDSLCALADVFHVSVDYLVGFSKEMTIDIAKYSDSEKEMILRMLAYFEKMHEFTANTEDEQEEE